MKNTIKCELCGLECSMQIPRTHLKKAHNMTTKEYKALGYQTLSEARLYQLRQSPVGNGSIGGSRDQHGEKHWNWKGGHITRSGYRITYRNGRRDYEHRLVAEEAIGRPLEKGEVVHHIDGNRANNAPENLLVMPVSEHDKLKDGTRAYFFTNEDVVEAAKTLYGLGWAKTKIERALRIHHNTLKRWLESD
jgi:hypothetical protein